MGESSGKKKPEKRRCLNCAYRPPQAAVKIVSKILGFNSGKIDPTEIYLFPSYFYGLLHNSEKQNRLVEVKQEQRTGQSFCWGVYQSRRDSLATSILLWVTFPKFSYSNWADCAMLRYRKILNILFFYFFWRLRFCAFLCLFLVALHPQSKM